MRAHYSEVRSPLPSSVRMIPRSRLTVRRRIANSLRLVALEGGFKLRAGKFCRFGPGFASPEETKAFTMPAEERVGLNDQQSLLPADHAAGQCQQPEPIMPFEMRASDLALQNDEWLAQEPILGNQ